MADENPEEPTLRTRSMADVLAEQGDIVGALEHLFLNLFQFVLPLRLRRKKPESCTIVSPHWFPGWPETVRNPESRRKSENLRMATWEGRIS